MPPSSKLEIVNFFTDVINSCVAEADRGPKTAVVNVYLKIEKCFAFVEFGSVAVTTAVLALDGITFKGATLRIRRPNDYNASAIPPSVIAKVLVGKVGQAIALRSEFVDSNCTSNYVQLCSHFSLGKAWTVKYFRHARIFATFLEHDTRR